jgi:transposase-like protein
MLAGMIAVNYFNRFDAGYVGLGTRLWPWSIAASAVLCLRSLTATATGYSFHIANVTAKTLRQTIVRVVDRDSYLMTDELASYTKLGREFSAHGTVNHSANEYVRFGGFMHVNTAECRFQPHEARFARANRETLRMSALP